MHTGVCSPTGVLCSNLLCCLLQAYFCVAKGRSRSLFLPNTWNSISWKPASLCCQRKHLSHISLVFVLRIGDRDTLLARCTGHQQHRDLIGDLTCSLPLVPHMWKASSPAECQGMGYPGCRGPSGQQKAFPCFFVVESLSVHFLAQLHVNIPNLQRSKATTFFPQSSSS